MFRISLRAIVLLPYSNLYSKTRSAASRCERAALLASEARLMAQVSLRSGAKRSVNEARLCGFILYALVGLGRVLEGRQDVWVGTTLDAVDEVGYLAEAG